MKKKIFLLFGSAGLIATLFLLSLQSCTKDFEELNTDPFGISDEQLAVDYKLVGEQFKQVLQNIYTYSPAWVTQLQQNLIGDVYSGYMMPPTPFRGNSNNMNYDLVDGWNEWPWNVAYSNVMAPLLSVDQKAGNEFENFKAWAKICRVAAMHRISDIYGPIIYTKYGQVTAGGGIEYDCQDAAYDAFFKDLDAAITTLTGFANSDPSKPFTKFDLAYDGDYTKWVKLANSLRLRLAIRISKVNAARAKTEAEAAVNHPLGVITSNDDNFLVRSDAGLTHPLNVMDNAWNDIRMGAPMESILTGYNDPRLVKYFLPSAIVPGVHKGIRNGIAIAAKSDYEGFSALVDLGKVQLMTAAEVYFLRAEGALRGWNMGGTAKQLYESGVQSSFDQYGLGDAAAYLNNGSSTPKPYVDPVNPANNVPTGSPHLSTATIKWDDAASFETKLEKIITQKWIAMYPDGQEGWSEFRRTGYPKLFPVVINNSGGKISTEAFIKRINFPAPEFNTNSDEVQKAIQCLKGADTGGTALWWDVD
jgi:hypothetical protein